MNDEQLVVLAQSGDAQAFNRLASRWEGSLYGFVRRTLGNEDDARDVCQEALLKAYQNIQRLREGAKFKSWIHHIALNLCRDRFRSTKVRGRAVSIDDTNPEDLEREAPTGAVPRAADGDAEADSLRGLLDQLLGELPEEQKTCLLLREYHGFNSEEISQITGAPAATVRTRIFYGLKSVRQAVERRGLDLADFR